VKSTSHFLSVKEEYTMYTNINIMNRVGRVVLSVGLVFAVMSVSGPLGTLVALPFVSIYAGITGFIGWDPVAALLGKVHFSPVLEPKHVPHDGLAAH
jgi:hypothetical protein